MNPKQTTWADLLAAALVGASTDGTVVTVRGFSMTAEWDDKGARVKSTRAMKCPSCGRKVQANKEHRCGDMRRKGGDR